MLPGRGCGMSLMLCACGEPLRDGEGFCSPCRESLGLPPVPEPIKSHVWTEAEREAYRARNLKATQFAERVVALPEPEVDDPFVGIGGRDLSVGMRHTGAGGLR